MLNKNTEHIADLFDSIAPKYDFLNHLLSLNFDKKWRTNVKKQAQKINPRTIIDVATGTGDLAFELSKITNCFVYGIDISKNMIELARKKQVQKKIKNIEFLLANSENLPFDNENADLITCSFGIRNFENIDKSLQEFYRVLKKNGKLFILEFTLPKNIFFKKIFQFYFTKILPFIGNKISKHNFAYSYLPNSVNEFPQYENFTKILEKNNFKNIAYKPYTLGIVTLYIAEK